MAVVSRLQLNHPALGTAGGAGLHSSIEALYTKIGDNMNDRWYSLADFDQAETVDLVHNFDSDISSIQYDLWNFTGGEWVLLTEATTPKRSDFSVVEKTGDEATTLQITNNTGGNDLTFAVSLVFGVTRLDQGDVQDVDVQTTPPEDGQALVYEAASGKFKPGASGDASFKLQGVTDPNATLKGGFILLGDGRELATYDGSGSASTDYGKDITINLDTILGTDPTNATTYYLYIDLNSLSSEVTLSDNGRKVYGVVEANFHLSTIAPELKDQVRYVPVGFIRSATSGTVWSGAGAAFGTLATRAHQKYAGEETNNYVLNPSALINATDGVVAAGSGFTVTRGTTAATFANTYFAINGNTTINKTVDWTLNTLQEKHNGQLMRFSMRCKLTLDTGSTGVYKIGLYDGSAYVAGTELTLTDGANVKWEALFVLDMTKTYVARLECTTAGDADDLILVDDVTVSPELTVAGSTKTQWKTATGLFSFTNRAGGALDFTRSAEAIFYAQDGENLYLSGTFSASSAGTGVGTADIIAIRSASLTFNYNKMANSSTLGSAVGEGLWYDGGNLKVLSLITDGNTTPYQITFAENGLTRTLREGDIANGDIVNFLVGPIPIAEWAGSSLTMANSQVEYASNTNANGIANTNYNSSTTSYNPLGTPIVSIASTTANTFTSYDVLLPTPLKATDKVYLEMSNNQVGWTPLPPPVSQGTSRYGAFWEATSSTTIRVYFGNKGARPTNATYAGDGEAWSSYSTYNWRITKAQNPIGIGTGLATATQPGALSQINRFQSKHLTSNITSTTNPITDLTFNNLVVGKFYQINLTGFAYLLGNSASEEVRVRALHNSNIIDQWNLRADLGATDAKGYRASTIWIFQATATTLTFSVDISGNGALNGSANGYDATRVTLIELGSYQATTAFT
jgi:hypothetical protein